MPGKLPSYKYCPFCDARVPAQAIICLKCEAPLVLDDDPDSEMFDPPRPLAAVVADYAAFMEPIEAADALPDYLENPEEEW